MRQLCASVIFPRRKAERPILGMEAGCKGNTCGCVAYLLKGLYRVYMVTLAPDSWRLGVLNSHSD